jgi:CheY-like chemotaxis protein
MGILVIDDDDDIREAVQEVLRAEGYDTDGAANGELARQMLENTKEPPRLILLDLMMPVMDGWDFLFWLDDNAELRKTPVAIMSAHPSIQRALDIARARHGAPELRLHGGTRRLLPKPISFLQLLAVANETCSDERHEMPTLNPVRPPPSKDDRRLALFTLQRLLVDAEASLSAGDATIDPALRRVGKAFDHFRSKYGDGREKSVPQTPATEARRLALLALARVIGEMDESVSLRDPESVRAALENAREALDICRHLDDSAHSSGFRMRFPAKLAK